jgi:hypothetical protein
LILLEPNHVLADGEVEIGQDRRRHVEQDLHTLGMAHLPTRPLRQGVMFPLELDQGQLHLAT